MESFNKDILKIFSMLKAYIPFSFSKYADGEFDILINKRITNCDNWTFNPATDEKYRNELMYSFKFNEPNYFVGISCPCCVNMNDVKWMRENVGVPATQLTWANIFVNGNYNTFKSLFIPEFKNHRIILVANENATIEKLPFPIEKYIPVTMTAWKDNFNLIDELSNDDISDRLFLFCAGPLGNMLAARMWEKNKNNIYMDIGSTLNPWLVGNNRGYLRGADTLKKTCIW